jgi:hypothetical protein
VIRHRVDLRPPTETTSTNDGIDNPSSATTDPTESGLADGRLATRTRERHAAVHELLSQGRTISSISPGHCHCTHNLQSRLNELGIPATFHLRNSGTHPVGLLAGRPQGLMAGDCRAAARPVTRARSLRQATGHQSRARLTPLAIRRDQDAVRTACRALRMDRGRRTADQGAEPAAPSPRPGELAMLDGADAQPCRDERCPLNEGGSDSPNASSITSGAPSLRGASRTPRSRPRQHRLPDVVTPHPVTGPRPRGGPEHRHVRNPEQRTPTPPHRGTAPTHATPARCCHLPQQTNG